MDDQAVTNPRETPRWKMGKFAMLLYGALFLITVILAVAGVFLGSSENLILSAPIIVIMVLIILTDRKYVHIPPALVLMMMCTFYLMLIGRMTTASMDFTMVCSFLAGVNFGLLGLILVYMLLKSMPGVRDENPGLVSFIVVSVSIALFTLLKLIQYAVSLVWTDMTGVLLDPMMYELVLVILGSLMVGVLYHTDRRHLLFEHTLNFFMEENSEFLGLEEKRKTDMTELIEMGESGTLEFKSTLRTNLETGEVDKRMEKAVLKTIVAFLNSNGGSLMIGVNDDGEIVGADLQSFANRDKMGLHLTNLISSQIGNSFLPYISFDMVDFEDKVVIWVRCLVCPEPVFLRDGKVEVFYVRSGPSTVELTGMSLIDYVNNRRKDMTRLGRLFD